MFVYNNHQTQQLVLIVVMVIVNVEDEYRGVIGGSQNFLFNSQ
jgi:hypothetical protein